MSARIDARKDKMRALNARIECAFHKILRASLRAHLRAALPVPARIRCAQPFYFLRGAHIDARSAHYVNP
jgi:hypothetical protein